MKSALFKIPVFLLTAIVTVAVAYLTLSSDPLDGMRIPLFYGADKAVHFIMFLGVGGCLRFDLGRVAAWCRRRRLSVLCVGATVVYGGLIEIVQDRMAAGRSGDALDFAADAAGAVVGVWTAYGLFFKNLTR